VPTVEEVLVPSVEEELVLDGVDLNVIWALEILGGGWEFS